MVLAAPRGLAVAHQQSASVAADVKWSYNVHLQPAHTFWCGKQHITRRLVFQASLAVLLVDCCRPQLYSADVCVEPAAMQHVHVPWLLCTGQQRHPAAALKT